MKTPRFIYLLLTLSVLIATTITVIFFASGYRIDFKTQSIHGTGIISVRSVPDGALVYINDIPKDASDTSITELKPGSYHLRLEKDGFATWEKDLDVEAELVTKAEALLIPLYPSFKPLTFTGVQRPSMSPDNQKIVYFVKNNANTGVWLMNLEERPFNLSRQPELLLTESAETPYSDGTISWAPTSDKFLLELPEAKVKPENRYRIYDLSSGQISSVSNKENLLQQWADQEQLTHEEQLSALPKEDIATINNLNVVAWSPDNNYILHSLEEGEEIIYKVYQIKPTIKTGSTVVPSPTEAFKRDVIVLKVKKDLPHKLTWYPDSRHFILTEESSTDQGSIEIIESDGGNRTPLFSGTIKDMQAFPYPNGSKVIILTRFNPQNESYNLYSIELR